MEITNNSSELPENMKVPIQNLVDESVDMHIKRELSI